MRRTLTNVIALSAFSATCLGLLAASPMYRNALSSGPVISKHFKNPPPAPDVKALERDSLAMLAKKSVEMPSLHASAPAGVELPAIVASVYDYATKSIGMYRLPDVSGGEMEKLSDVSSYYGGTLHNGLYYACHDGRFAEYWNTDSDPHGHKIQAYDPATWTPTGTEINVSKYRASDLAIHPQTGVGYAFCDYGSMMYRLFSINLSTGEEVDLAPGVSFIGDDSRALAFDAEGNLYGVTKKGKFGKVDITNGKNAATVNLGLESDLQHNVSLAYDAASGNFLYMHNASPDWGTTQKSELYSINPNTGEYKLLADFTGKCITSMYVVEVQVADSAPGTPSDPVPSFADGALSGTLTFTMPATLHDGSAASGEATWKVYDGKTELATGTAPYGSEVSAPVTVEAAGKHNFTVSASNADGEGKKSRVSVWVGPDVPKAPQGVEVAYDEPAGKFSISWQPVTEGVNGGYVDPSQVLYTVTRLPGDVVVAENISGTQAEAEYVASGIESISFKVTASQGSLVSDAAVSAPTMTGSMPLPYDLANAEKYKELTNWTLVDANGDKNTWTSGYSGVYYSYSSASAADDWAITPPMKAREGDKFKVHMAFSCQLGSCPERVEVKAGYGADPSAMTMELLPPTVIDQTTPMAYDFEVRADRDGKIFLGIHALSDANMYKLNLKELRIAAPIAEISPAAPVISELKADPSGALSASGKIQLPTVSVKDQPLDSISSVEVWRNGAPVLTLTDVAPGAIVEFTDSLVSEAGVYSYQAYAYCDGVRGDGSELLKTFVGINRPGDVKNIHVARSVDNPSQLEVTWDAADTDWAGYPLNGECTYSVEIFPDNAYYKGNATYADITDLKLTAEPTFDTGRDHGFVYVKVSAVNSAGKGYAAKSDNIFVGKALTLPFKESFPNYTLEHPWGDGPGNGPQIASITDDERALSLQQYNGWNRLMDASFKSADGSQDNDNGFAGMFGWSYLDDNGQYKNEWNELLSPVINLSGLEKPILSFYTFNFLQYTYKDMNRLEVDVVTADGTRTNALDIIIGDLGDTQGWEQVLVDLTPYKDQEVSLIFKGTIYANDVYGYNWVLIDNLRIEPRAETDLKVSDISAPVQAAPGEPFSVKARVSNLGLKDVAVYKATLKHNDEVVETKDCGAISSNKSEMVEFTHKLAVQDPIGNRYQISIEVEGDETPDNNVTTEVTVARNLKLLPPPSKVSINPEATAIYWDEPDMENAVPEAVLETFESYPVYDMESFLTEAGDWVFVDVDQAPIGGIISSSTWQMIEFPGIPTHSAQSWWVQSRLFEEFNDGYYGHGSSLQYLANMYVVNDTFTRGEQQDDWAISPELCGSEQLLTLWARSYNRSTPETVEFLWSEGGTNPADFKLLQRVEELPAEWTQYALVVPEGGRRFAIRGCSYAEMGTSQTFIDDVCFYPADGIPQDLLLNGYNLYCDGQLLASLTPDVMKHVSLPAGEHEYAVSALYTTGESRAVPAEVDNSGVRTLTSALKVYASNGMLCIDGLAAQPYTVSTTSGIILSKGQGLNEVKVPVSASGVYMVKAAGRLFKVIVK